jgi:hypothetical protein
MNASLRAGTNWSGRLFPEFKRTLVDERITNAN